jgi:DNA-binding response OmpR family regulator
MAKNETTAPVTVKRHSANIAIVEDDDHFREMLTMQLENMGFQVSTYKDGDVAKRMLPALTTVPDLLFLDLILPKVNGVDVLKLIRQTPRIKNLPTVIMTGNKDESLVKACIKLGVRDFLRKPTSEAVLRTRLKCLNLNFGANDARAILSLCLMESPEVFTTPTFRRFRNKGLKPFRIQYQGESFIALMNSSFSRAQLLMLDEDMIIPQFKIYADEAPWIPIWPRNTVVREIKAVDEADLKKSLGGELFDLVNNCAGGAAGSGTDAA